MSKSRLVVVLCGVMLLGTTPGVWALPTVNLEEWGRAAWIAVFGPDRLAVKHGCRIDPDGSSKCQPTNKGGCEINPDGSSTCQPVPKAGCGINPDGTPRCTP